MEEVMLMIQEGKEPEQAAAAWVEKNKDKVKNGPNRSVMILRHL